MRQVVGGIAAFAFAALFVQSPWAHVHTGAHDSDHHQQQHRQLVLAHGHDLEAAAADQQCMVPKVRPMLVRSAR